MQTSIENIKDSINKSTQKDFLHKLFFLNSVAKQEYTVVDGKIPLPPALQMGIGGRAIFTGDKSGKAYHRLSRAG